MVPLYDPGLENHVLSKKGFAGFGRPQQDNVFNVFIIIDFHGGKCFRLSKCSRTSLLFNKGRNRWSGLFIAVKLKSRTEGIGN